MSMRKNLQGDTLAPDVSNATVDTSVAPTDENITDASAAALPADQAEAPAPETAKPAAPGLDKNCLTSNDELAKELNRLFDIFKNDKSLSPYTGNIHEKRQALSRDLHELISKSPVADTRKIELYDAAILHDVFDHQRFPMLKHAFSTVVRWAKPKEHPTPVLLTQSHVALMHGREALIAKMKAAQEAQATAQTPRPAR